jgi:hypothetical protein
VGKAVDNVKVTVKNVEGTVVREMDMPGTRGLHAIDLNVRPSFGRGGFGGGGRQMQQQRSQATNRPLTVGQHLLTIAYGDEEFTTVIEVLPDPRGR